MKFNKYLPEWKRELLETQYKEYIRITPMTKKEQRLLREWVKDGNSVYENGCSAWNDGQVPVEFLTVYREEEYIRQNTKEMSPEEARIYALEYYGWLDDDKSPCQDLIHNAYASGFCRVRPVVDDSEKELPFN